MLISQALPAALLASLKSLLIGGSFSTWCSEEEQHDQEEYLSKEAVEGHGNFIIRSYRSPSTNAYLGQLFLYLAISQSRKLSCRVNTARVKTRPP